MSASSNLELDITTQAETSGMDDVIAKCRELSASQQELASSTQQFNSSMANSNSGLAAGVAPLTEMGKGYKDVADKTGVAGGAISQFNGSISSSQTGIKDATQNFAQYGQAAANSGKGLDAAKMSTTEMLGSFTALGGGILGMVSTFTSLERAGLMVDKAEKAVTTSTEAARKAQADYNSMLALASNYSGELARRQHELAAAQAEVARLTASGQINTAAGAAALQRLASAQQAVTEAQKSGVPTSEELAAAHAKVESTSQGASIAEERLGLAQEHQTEAFAESALSTISSVASIAGSVASMGKVVPAALSRAKEGFTDFAAYARRGSTAAQEASTGIEEIGPAAIGAAGSLGLIGVAIGAGIGGFLLFRHAYETNFLGFGDAVNKAIQAAQNFGGALQIAFEYLKSGDPVSAFKVVSQSINDGIMSILSSADAFLGNFPSKIGAALSAAVSTAGQKAGEIGQAIVTGIQNFTTQVLDFGAWIQGGLSNALGQASSGAAAIGTAIYNTLSTFGGKVLNYAQPIIAGLSNALGQASSGAAAISTAIYNTLSTFGGKVLDYAKPIIGALSNALSQASSGAAAIGTAIYNTLSNFGGKVLDFAKPILSGLSNALSAASQGAATIGTAIYNTLSNFGGKVLDFASPITTPLRNALAPVIAVATAIGTAIHDNVLAPLAGIGAEVQKRLSGLVPKDTGGSGTGSTGVPGSAGANLEEADRRETLKNQQANQAPKVTPQSFDTSGANNYNAALTQIVATENQVSSATNSMGGAFQNVVAIQNSAANAIQMTNEGMLNQGANLDELAGKAGMAGKAQQDQKKHIDDMSKALSDYDIAAKDGTQSTLNYRQGIAEAETALMNQANANQVARSSLQYMSQEQNKAIAGNLAYDESLLKTSNSYNQIAISNRGLQGQIAATNTYLGAAAIQQDLFNQGALKQVVAMQGQREALYTAAGAYAQFTAQVASGEATSIAFQAAQIKQANSINEQKVAIAGAAGALTVYADQVQSGEAQQLALTQGILDGAKAALDEMVAVSGATGKLAEMSAILQSGALDSTLFQEGVNKANQAIYDQSAALIQNQGYLETLQADFNTAEGQARLFATGQQDMATKTLQAAIALQEQAGAIQQYETYLGTGAAQGIAFAKGFLDQKQKADEFRASVYTLMGGLQAYAQALNNVNYQAALFATGEAKMKQEGLDVAANIRTTGGEVKQLETQLMGGARASNEFTLGLLQGRKSVQELAFSTQNAIGQWVGFNAAIKNLIASVGGRLPAGLQASNKELQNMYQILQGLPDALAGVQDQMNKLADDVLKGLVKGLEGGGSGKSKQSFQKALQDLVNQTDLTFSPNLKADLKAGASIAQLHDQIQAGLGVFTIAFGMGDLKGASDVLSQMDAKVQSMMAKFPQASQRLAPLHSALGTLNADMATLQHGGTVAPEQLAFHMNNALIATNQAGQSMGSFATRMDSLSAALQGATDPASALDNAMQALHLHADAMGNIITDSGLKVGTLAQAFQAAGDTIDSAGNIIDSTGKVIGQLPQALSGTSSGLNQTADAANAALNAAQQADPAFQSLLTTVSGGNTLFASLAQTAQNAFGSISTNVNALATGISGSFIAAVAAANQVLASMVGTAQNAFGAIANGANTVASGVNSAFKTAQGDAQGYLNSIAAAATTAFSKAGNAATAAATGVNNAFKKAQGDAQGYLNSIASAATAAFGKVGTSATAVTTGVNNAFKKAQGDAQGYLNSIVSASTSAFAKVASAASSRLSAIPGMFARIQSSANSAVSSINRVASAINALHDKTVTITTRYVTVGSPVFAQHGFEGIVPNRTQFVVGEAGPEYVSVTPLRGGNQHSGSRGLPGRGDGGNGKGKVTAMIKQPLHVEFVSQMNGREMAKQLAQYELDISAEL